MAFWSDLGKGLPVTPILTTGLAATLSSPPMLFVAEHLYNHDVDDDDDDDDDDGDIYIMMQCVCVCHEKSSLPPGSLL